MRMMRMNVAMTTTMPTMRMQRELHYWQALQVTQASGVEGFQITLSALMSLTACPLRLSSPSTFSCALVDSFVCNSCT